MSCAKCGQPVKSTYTICWTCHEATRGEPTGACVRCSKAIRPEFKLCFVCREAGKALLTGKCTACALSRTHRARIITTFGGVY